MKVAEIPFTDESFKACVLETGCEEAEDIVELRCRRKKIEDTTGLEYLTSLKLLDLTRNKLTELDVSKNINLEELFVGNNELVTLDLSQNKALKHLELFINEIEEIDVSSNTQLEELYLDKNELSEIDLSKNTALLDFRISSNELTEIDLTQNSMLEKLVLEKNKLPEDIKADLLGRFQEIEVHV